MDFLKTPIITNKHLMHPRMAYVRNRIKENTKTAIEYYRTNFHYIPSNHVIVRLCKVLLAKFDVASYDSFDKALLKMQLEDFAEEHARMLGIGTNFKTGIIQTYFYKRDYLYITNTFKASYDSPWDELQPVKVKSHGRNDLSYGAIKPSDDYSQNQISAIEIDIHALLIMLHEYFHPDNNDLDDRKNLERFVSQYVFPNMLPSHIDVAWYNRVDSLLTLEPLRDLKAIPGLTLPGNGPYLDLVAENYSIYAKDSNVNLGEAAVLIEGIFTKNLFECYQLNDIAPTNSGLVWITLSRCNALSLLLDVSINTEVANKRYVNHIAQFLKQVSGNGAFNRLNSLEDEEGYINAELFTPVNRYGHYIRYI